MTLQSQSSFNGGTIICKLGKFLGRLNLRTEANSVLEGDPPDVRAGEHGGVVTLMGLEVIFPSEGMGTLTSGGETKELMTSMVLSCC